MAARLWKTLEAADTRSQLRTSRRRSIDLRSLRPLDDATIMASVRKTRRAVIVDEGWRSGSLAAEICTRIVEQAFWALDAPIGRVCSEEVPIPYARHLEEAAIPQVTENRRCGEGRAWAERKGAQVVAEFRMPSLGADMEAGTLVEWLVKPGDQVKRGDIVAVVETQKGAIEIEIFDTGQIEQILVELDTKVPVGTPLARRADASGGAGPGRGRGTADRRRLPLRRLSRARRHHPPLRQRRSSQARRHACGSLQPRDGSRSSAASILPPSPRAVRVARLSAPISSSHRREGCAKEPPTGFDLAAMRSAIAAAMARSKREIPHYYLAQQIDDDRLRAMAHAHECQAAAF